MAKIEEQKQEYNERANAVESFVNRNLTTDTDATKRGINAILPSHKTLFNNPNPTPLPQHDIVVSPGIGELVAGALSRTPSWSALSKKAPPYTPKVSAMPGFTTEQNAAADALYNKAFPVATSEEIATAKKDLASGILPPTNLSTAEKAMKTASDQAADIRETQRQKEFAEYQTRPQQSYGMGGGAYENIDMKKGNITLYGEKPQPYKGLSAESQQLIKEMDEKGVSVGRRAEVIQNLIRAEKGEAGATERAKLGMAKDEFNRAATLEQDMKKHTDLLLRQGRQEEAAAESENFKQVKDTYTRKDEAGNEYLDLSGIADQFKNDWSKLNPTMREAVFGHIRRFDADIERTMKDPAEAPKLKGMTRDELWRMWSKKNRS